MRRQGSFGAGEYGSPASGWRRGRGHREAERYLADHADVFTPTDFTRICAKLEDALNPDGFCEPEDLTEKRAFVDLTKRARGGYRITGLLSHAMGAKVQAALDSIAPTCSGSPGRGITSRWGRGGSASKERCPTVQERCQRKGRDHGQSGQSDLRTRRRLDRLRRLSAGQCDPPFAVHTGSFRWFWVVVARSWMSAGSSAPRPNRSLGDCMHEI